MPAHFDLCIIGAGSGNTILDDRFDSWSVAIVERDAFGGTCLNRGCIPSKMLVHPADVVETIRHAGRVGIDAEATVRWADIRDRTFARIEPIASGGLVFRRGQPNVTVFEHDARFVGHKMLAVGGDTITADRFVIAAGARSHIPHIPGLAELVTPRRGVHTSDTIMRIDEVPRRLIILGGGFIAAELGHVFDAFGSEVTLVIRGGSLLRQEDEEVSRRVTARLAERLDLVRFARVRRVDAHGDGYRLECDTPAGERVIDGDAILLAAGRVPNGGQLDVEATGVHLDADGYVVADETGGTGVEGIWALGDVHNRLQLKHLANLQARIVRHNLLHPDAPRAADTRVVPHAIFTSPQVGAVGITEEQAEMHGRPFVTVVTEFGDTAYGWSMEDTTSCAKLIADVETRMLVGAHVVGPQASILIQQLVQGMRFGQSVDQMAVDVIYPHPALSEVIENALVDLVDALDSAGADARAEAR